MIVVEINLDEKYTFYNTKSKNKYIELINQGVIIKKDTNAAIIGSRILLSQKGRRKYVKVFFLWVSIFFFPIKGFSKLVYSKDRKVDVLFFGRSKRVKIIKNGFIVNKVNRDKFSLNDFYFRKKINDLNISPKILDVQKNYYKEELLLKYKFLKENNLAEKEISLFKSSFKSFKIEKNKYAAKIVNKIRRLNNDIGSKLYVCKNKGDLNIEISHGDLINKNILVDNSSKVFLIDFEFSAYRSEFYDNLFVLYYNDRDEFYKNTYTFNKYIFVLERLLLILKLQTELEVSYASEIEGILNYLEYNRNEY